MAHFTLDNELTPSVCHDVRTIRALLKRIRHDERFANLRIFKSRLPNPLERQDERRSRDRHLVCWPIQVRPVNFAHGVIEYTNCPVGEFHVYSQDVTLRGLKFLHTEPLYTQHAVLSFDLTESERVSLLMELRWTTTGWDQPFLGCGKFLFSGGKFLGIVEASEF